MASGTYVIKFKREMFPATLFARPGQVTGGSTPAERIPVLLFHQSTVEYMDYLCQLVGYDGGGITLTFLWSSGATSGNVIWSAAFRRLNDDAEDVDTSHSYTYNDVTDAAPTASREQVYTSLTFTDGADMDSVADGEFFILRIRRFSSDGADTMNSNDAELWAVSGRET